MVRVLAGQGVLAEWFLEINDCATIDVISGFGDMPLLLSAETSLFDVHYPGRFLFGANRVSHNLIEMLLSNDAEGIRLVHPNNNIYGFLHAKIYRARYDQGREDEVTLWAIGSANLTGSSLNRSWESIVIFDAEDESPFSDDEWDAMIAPNANSPSILLIGSNESLESACLERWTRQSDTGQFRRSTSAQGNDENIPETSGWGFAITLTDTESPAYRYRSIPRVCVAATESTTGLIQQIHPAIGNDGIEAVLILDNVTHIVTIRTNNQSTNSTGQLNIRGVPDIDDTLAPYTTSDRVIRVSNLESTDGTPAIIDFPYRLEVENSLRFHNSGDAMRARRYWAIFDRPGNDE
jgi:hypothetical protein